MAVEGKKNIKKRVWLLAIKPVGRFIATFVLKRPEYSYLFATRYPSFKSFFVDLINQLFRSVGITRVLPFRSLIIEVTNTCNLRCSHCPTHTTMTRQREMLDFKLFTRIIDDNPQLDRVVLMNWGEPLLHPQLIDMISYASKKNIETHITTNGTLLSEDMMRALLKSGLTRISFSMDGVGETYRGIRGVDYQALENTIVTFLRLRDEMEKDIQVELSVTVFNETEKDIQKLFDQWSSRVNFIKLRPQEISRSVVKKKSCWELWRTATILSSGVMTGCSVDYNGVLNLGDVRNESLRTIINSKKVRELRRNHLKGTFAPPCSKCDEYQTAYARPRFNEPAARRAGKRELTR